MSSLADVDICNLALGHLSITKTIANLDTDNSVESKCCNRFYPIARDKSQRDHNWAFNRRFATLGLISLNPTCEWGYSYREPAGAIRLRKILSGIRNDNQNTLVPYLKLADDTGGLIYTDQVNAQLEYSVSVTDTTKFEDDYILALSYLLASLMASSLTGGDPDHLGDKAMQSFMKTIGEARSNDFNEQQADIMPESEFIVARGEGPGTRDWRCRKP